MRILKNIKKTFLGMDKTILFISLILIVFGTLNIVTASSREAVVNLDASIYYYFYRHSIILIISLYHLESSFQYGNLYKMYRKIFFTLPGDSRGSFRKCALVPRRDLWYNVPNYVMEEFT